MTVRSLLASMIVLASLAASTARAQPPLVPAPRVEAGAMSAGCPSDWEHREAGVGSFSCRDTETSAYCGMRAPSADDGLTAARTLDDAVTWTRSWLTAQGAHLLGERREARAHLIWLELRGQRLAVVLVPDGRGYAQVSCGAGTADLDALLPTFLAIAQAARR